MRSLLPLAVFCLLLSAPASATPALLDAASKAYAQLDYEKCVQLLESARTTDDNPTLGARRELSLALCLYPLGRASEAMAHLTQAVELDARVPLPPFTSPKLAKYHSELVARAREAAAANESARPAAVPLDAPTQVTLLPVPGPPPLVAAGDLPRHAHFASLVSGGVGVAAAGVGVGLGVLARATEQSAHTSEFQSDAIRRIELAQRQATAANVAFAVAGTAAVVAVVAWVVEAW